MIAPEPYLSAYLLVMHETILLSRTLARRAKQLQGEQLDLALEQIADLQDAIHVIAELLNEWQRCDQAALRENFLAAYDRKWANRPAIFSVSLLDVLDRGLKHDHVPRPQSLAKKKMPFWRKIW